MKKKIGLYLQGIITLLAVVFAVITIFNREMVTVIQILLGLDLFVMAYNNLVLFKRKLFTILYAIAGVVVLVITILNWW